MKKQNNGKLRIIPLGGLEQIGMNITAFEYEDSIVVVDCGLAFPEDDMLGIDLVIPDVTYLKDNISKVKGFVITHGHEDHIGALPYVLKEINIPIYTTKLTMGIIENKLKEHNLLRGTKRKVVRHGQSINLGKFRIIETRNPANYTGKYEKDVVFQKKADTDIDEILLQAENTPMILPLGTITVTKKIKENDITWAHGNPTFFFVAEGTDLSGAAHRYEDYVTFVPDSYETDGNGYATISVTLRNIPLGQYTIWEKPVLRYYLKDAWADTENVRITKKAEATYGKDPKETAVGTAALTVEKPDAALTFLNEKARYDKFSHTDCIKNTIPLLFS